jgi:hypothetical protein
MTKRLQVLFDDDELLDIQLLARRRRQTTAELVREALRTVLRGADSYPDPEPKLRAVREALAYSYPIADVEALNVEIEQGYLESDSRDRPEA